MWTKADQARANDEGWGLVTTFTNGDTHPLWDIAVHGNKFKSDRDASLAVIATSRGQSPFHLKALKLVMSSRSKT